MGCRIPLFEHKPFVYADEWAEQNMILSNSGRFSYDVTPYFRTPTRCASDPIRHCRVVVVCPAQAGKSQMLINVLCHSAIYDPSNTLVILDTLKTAQRLSKNRIKPALRDFAHVASLKRGAAPLDKSSETMNISLGTGANLLFGASASASDLCSTPVKLLCLDELDRFVTDLNEEGDPITLALKRQLRFRDSMAVLTSTPTTEDGAITRHYLLGTQEVWSAQCECGEWLSIPFDDIDFSADTPTYTCPKCGTVYSESDVTALPHDYAPRLNDEPYTDRFGRVCRSFRFTSTLMHGIYTWDQIERERKQAETLGVAAIRSFRNTALGEPYTPPQIEIEDYTGLLAHRMDYTLDRCPDFITEVFAGIDTQDSLFEIVVIGCNADASKVAFLEHRQIVGDLATDTGVWDALKAYINKFKCTNSKGTTHNINLVCHDCGGHFYHEILALGLQSPLWRPIKGRSYQMNVPETAILDRVVRKNVAAVGHGTGRVDLTFVNTRYTKDLIYYKLHEILANRDCGFYFTSDPVALFDANFFEQLTSETKEKTSTGNDIYKLKVGFHNECLDCTVYALAAAELYRLAMCRLPSVETKPAQVAPSEQVATAAQATPSAHTAPPEQVATAVQESAPPKRKRRTLLKQL